MISVEKIIAYEGGEMGDKDMVEFFSELVKTGNAWTLQGHYGRTAMNLIENEVIDRQGNILIDLDELEIL